MQKKYTRIYKQINKLPEQLILLYRTYNNTLIVNKPIKESLSYYSVKEDKKYIIIKSLLNNNIGIPNVEHMEKRNNMYTLPCGWLITKDIRKYIVNYL